MSILSFLGTKLAGYAARRVQADSQQAVARQESILATLLRKGATTHFGRDHGLAQVRNHEDYIQQVPVRDYEALRPWLDRMAAGETDVLWPGKPLYISKTSGTTSGIKYIPLTGDSLPNHIGSMRNALYCYIAEKGQADFLNGKLIFVSGSPALERKHGIY